MYRSSPATVGESVTNDQCSNTSPVICWELVSTTATIRMSRMAAVLARSEAQTSKQLGHDGGSADPYAKLSAEISSCDATDSRKIAVVILARVTMNGAVNTRLPVETSRGANLARHRRLSSFALALSLGFPLSFSLAFTLRFSLISILKRSCCCMNERVLLARIGVIIVIITLRPI